MLNYCNIWAPISRNASQFNLNSHNILPITMLNTWAPSFDGWRFAVYAVMVKDGVGWSRKSWNWANDYVVAQTILLPPPLSCHVESCAWVCLLIRQLHSAFTLLFSSSFLPSSENANGMAPGLCKHSLVIREFTFRIPPLGLGRCRAVEFLRISIGRAGSLKELKWER